MKNQQGQKISGLAAVILLILFLRQTEQVRLWATQALQLCGRSVIPSLFPFLVVIRVCIATGLGEWIAPLFSGIMTSLYHLPGSAGTAVLLGLIGGYPTGARTAVQLFQEGLLTQDETERLLPLANNANPVFFFSVLGAGVFGNLHTGIWLWLIHIASALIAGLFFRGQHHNHRSHDSQFPDKNSHTDSLASILTTAVQDALAGVLSACAFVSFFYILAQPLSVLGIHAGAVCTAILELFSLTPRLQPDAFGFILAAGGVSWGGLSVHFQTAAALHNTNLRLHIYFQSKILQAGIAVLLAFLLQLFILPTSFQVS